MRRASVQVSLLGLQRIEDGMVELSGGEYRAVLEVTGVSRPFDDDARLEGLLAGFAAFLNGLIHPIQIVVRASPVDLTRYVAGLEERGRQVLDGHLADLAHDHAVFVLSLARQRTLLERRFYIVIPSETTHRLGWVRRLGFGHRAADDEPVRDAARRQLAFRCDEVARHLARCGVTARRLGDLELAQLYLLCWSPERARAQRFRQQLGEYTTLSVRAAQPVAVAD